MSDHERIVRRLENQYTTQNDGGGRAGYCRVNSGDLLDLLQALAKLRADADKYRWLRGDCGQASVRWPRWCIQHWAAGTWNQVSGDAMDSAIDAAMAWDIDA